VAPILYHCALDGYVAMFVFVVLDFADVFVNYRLYMFFIVSGLLFRNYLFNVFKTSKTLDSKNLHNKVESRVVINNVKLLGSNKVQLMTVNLSTTFKYLRSRFF